MSQQLQSRTTSGRHVEYPGPCPQLGLKIPQELLLRAAERRGIVSLAFDHRLALVAGPREFASEGALMSYGADSTALYRRAASYVDRILKGETRRSSYRAADEVRTGGEHEDR